MPVAIENIIDLAIRDLQREVAPDTDDDNLVTVNGAPARIHEVRQQLYELRPGDPGWEGRRWRKLTNRDEFGRLLRTMSLRNIDITANLIEHGEATVVHRGTTYRMMCSHVEVVQGDTRAVLMCHAANW